METASRLRYYNPMLDHRTMVLKMTPKMRKAAEDGTYDDGTSAGGGPLNVPDDGHPYNLVSSLCDDGVHRPAIDVDIPCEYTHRQLRFPALTLTDDQLSVLADGLYVAQLILDREDAWVASDATVIDLTVPCRAVRSSTPGHHHLYIDSMPYTWDEYVALLEALVAAGIVERGYLMASKNRGQTLLRPPHVSKLAATHSDEIERAA